MMFKKIFVTFSAAAALILLGAGCSVPGEKNVISGNYLDHPKTPVSVPAPVAPTSTTSSAK